MTNRKGLTLIETVIGLTVIAVAFYLLIAIFITLAPRTARVETLNKKVYLAQEKMEEYLARSFAQTVTGETSGAFSGSFSNYQYRIIVTQVATGDLNTAVGYNTPFKNVKVRVWGGQPDAASTVEVVSLAISYEIQ